MSTCIRQTAASRPDLFSSLPSYFVAQYVLILVVFFLVKIFISFEKWVFSFDRSNMQIFTLNITRVVWPHVTSSLDLRYFCRHNPLLYHWKLIPGHYWSWQRIISFFNVKFSTSVVLSYQPFPNFFVKFVYSNGRLQSRILLLACSWWFCFFFWTTQVCWKVSNF